MKKIKLQFLKSIIVGFLVTLVSSCGSDKSRSAITEKITFPSFEFTLSATSDTTIFGEQGTRLFIEKGTFQFIDGTLVTDSIKVRLKEFYKKSDILLAELSTESNGKLLETGGMLNITATANGKEIEIKRNKRIVIHFPKPKDSYKQMNLFYSGKNATDTSVTNWEIDTVSLVKRTLKIGSYAWYHPSNDDSTKYDFTPKNFKDTGYYVNPLDLYLNKYSFSQETKKEIESTLNKTVYATLSFWNDYGIECEMSITKTGFIKNPKVNSKVSQSTRKEIIEFLKNLPQLEPGKNNKDEIIEREGLLFIQGGSIVPLYKTEEEYVKSFNSKYSKYEKTPIKNMDDAELNYFMFSVAKLGWINCDRFLESEKTVEYFVKAQEKDTKVKMVFKDIDGVLIAKLTEGKFVFSKVPFGKQVTIVALKTMNGQLQTAFQEVTISDKPLEALVFKETTLSELKQQLEKLN
jgi:hypothetical protein